MELPEVLIEYPQTDWRDEEPKLPASYQIPGSESPAEMLPVTYDPIPAPPERSESQLLQDALRALTAIQIHYPRPDDVE